MFGDPTGRACEARSARRKTAADGPATGSRH
jgi:hypothetical protein